METGDSETNRQNQAFLLRMQSRGKGKASLVLDLIAALFLAIHWYIVALIFLAIAAIMLIQSLVLDDEADAVWPEEDDR